MEKITGESTHAPSSHKGKLLLGSFNNELFVNPQHHQRQSFVLSGNVLKPSQADLPKLDLSTIK